jgi:SNF2 family DNA or RNA helicase
VHPFDDKSQFHTNFVSSIQKGNEEGIARLKALVQAISLRRTKASVLRELSLGPRVERVQSVTLSEEERTLYTIVKSGNSGSTRSIFQTITKLRQVCDHGRELLPPETLAILDQGCLNGERLEAISGESQSCECCGAAIQDSDLEEFANHLLSCLHLLCNRCFPKDERGNTEQASCPVCSGTGTSDSFSEDESVADPCRDRTEDSMEIDSSYRPSSKVLALLQNLRTDRLLGSAKDPIKR